MWHCQHCNKEFNFNKTADKANHSRWCDHNPKRALYTNNPNLINAVKTAKDKRHGKLSDYNVTCNKCGNTFKVRERDLAFPSKEKYYCSRTCANSHTVTDEHRRKTSETLTGKEYQPPCTLTKLCEECSTEFTYIKTGRNKHKRFCCRSCATKSSHRKYNEEARKKRAALQNYRSDCQFQFNLKDYPNEFEFTLIEKYGWYLPKNRGNNLNGVSRDHMVSVRFGFDNNIPPEHIRHPANCRLLQHNSNVSKGSKNSITYDQLLQRITAWDTKYIRCNKQASIAHDQDNKDRNNSFNR